MTDLTIDVYTSPARELANGGVFSPTTSTLIAGATEAVLVDTQHMPDDVAEVIRRIDASGRNLTVIYITHGHADHYFGLERLLDRYPRARAVTLPPVARYITATLSDDRERWRETFAGASLDNAAIPEPLEADSLRVDGHEVRAVPIEQADISPASIVHVPGIDAVIAGDAIYNGVNPFLAASGPKEWPKWVDSVDVIAALNPRIVVAGHKRPELPDDDLHATIDMTRDYLRAFISAAAECTDSRSLVARMQAQFPDNANPSALILSAVTAIRRRRDET
jgi:glyoxylase-like metal-dependent hydrolase (beta-lactamase superfamily II)